MENSGICSETLAHTDVATSPLKQTLSWQWYTILSDINLENYLCVKNVTKGSPTKIGTFLRLAKGWRPAIGRRLHKIRSSSKSETQSPFRLILGSSGSSARSLSGTREETCLDARFPSSSSRWRSHTPTYGRRSLQLLVCSIQSCQAQPILPRCSRYKTRNPERESRRLWCHQKRTFPSPPTKHAQT